MREKIIRESIINCRIICYLGIVDITTGQINNGVEIVPLQKMIMSGFYDEVAIRRLVDITDEQRETIHKKIMKVSIKPHL